MMKYILLFLFLAGCGSAIDAGELDKARDITCPSLVAAYELAAASDIQITPEEQALVDTCKEHLAQ